MTKLEELLYSLTTVLIRYHDSQPTVQKLITCTAAELRKKSYEYAVSLLNDPKKHYDARLNEIISNCTKEYGDRLHLLTYIHHEISFLKALLDNKVSFQKSQLDMYKEQITRLFVDLKQLLCTVKGVEYKVNYSKLDGFCSVKGDIAISLSGIKNPKYSLTNYCTSGFLIIEEILQTFNLTVSSTELEFGLLAQSLCSEHQNALLVPELLSELEELRRASEMNKNELSQFKQENEALVYENKVLKDNLQETQDALKQSEVKLITSKLVSNDNLPAKTSFINNPAVKPFSTNPAFLGIYARVNSNAPQDPIREFNPTVD